MYSAIPLPTRCSVPPWSHGAVRSRQYSPAATRSRASAPIAMIESRVSSAPIRTSATKITVSSASVASVTGGTRLMRRSKSTRRESNMSGVMRSGASGKVLTSAALAGVEHDPERHGHAPIERARGVGRQIENITIQQRELAVELAENLGVRTPDEHEVRPEESEEGAEDPPEQREHDRVLDRHREGLAPGARDVPALANDVVQVRLSQQREHLTRRRHDRIGPGQKRDALLLDHPEQGLLSRLVAIDRHVAARTQRHRDHQEDERRHRQGEQDDQPAAISRQGPGRPA